MSIRSQLWYDSPIGKHTALFHPQIIKQDAELDPQQSLIKPPNCPTQLMISAFKYHPGPLSPWSSCLNPQNERLSSQRRMPSLFRDQIPKDVGIEDLMEYSAEQEQNMVTPIRQKYDQSDDLQACELHTTGKKSEYGPLRKTRPKQKGLRQLSQRVYNIIQELERATYKDVAAQLVAELSKNKERDEKQEQNVKRRVYDALNVLISLGVLVKEGRKIACSKNKVLKSVIDLKQTSIQNLEHQLSNSQGILAQKRNKLKLTQQKYSFIQGLLNRNKQHQQVDNQIEFPFIGIMVKDQSLIRKTHTHDSLTIQSPEPLQLFGDIDSIKWLNEDLQLARTEKS